MNIRDAFYEVLRTHGITTIFGNPGSNELPLLRDFPADFRYILTLQEGAALAMADGFALATGKPALVNLHAAAGTGNAMGNLTNAQSGHVPVVVTAGQQARRYSTLNGMLTNVDAPKLAEPLVKWSHEPPRPQDVPQALSKGILLASSAPAGPVYLSVPLDDWDHDADASALAHLKSRAVDGDPVVPAQALAHLKDRLAAAKNPVMVAGPGIDNQAGWDGAIRLAEQLAMPVLVAPSPSRCPFPTRHPNFRGILPAAIPTVARSFEGHDVIVVFGAAIFRYHEFADGDYLPAGAEIWAVTADPDEAARAPFGHILIGDPSDAITRLADAMPATGRPPLSPATSPRSPTRPVPPSPPRRSSTRSTRPRPTAPSSLSSGPRAGKSGTGLISLARAACTTPPQAGWAGACPPPSACSSATPPGAWWRCSAMVPFTTPSAACGPPRSTRSRSSSSSRATPSTAR
jgi:benzoylformate decarboxylase